jgi:hypothetical protein
MLSQPQGHNAAGRIMSMKMSNDTIGNEPATFRLVAPNASPRTPISKNGFDFFFRDPENGGSSFHRHANEFLPQFTRDTA